MVCRAGILILPSNILTEPSSAAAAAPSKEMHMYLSARYMYLLPDLTYLVGMLFRTCEKLNLTLTHIKIISPAASGF